MMTQKAGGNNKQVEAAAAEDEIIDGQEDDEDWSDDRLQLQPDDLIEVIEEVKEFKKQNDNYDANDELLKVLEDHIERLKKKERTFLPEQVCTPSLLQSKKFNAILERPVNKAAAPNVIKTLQLGRKPTTTTSSASHSANQYQLHQQPSSNGACSTKDFLNKYM
ncbi:unnamed protein product [Amoebophrya sp. A25]|nr:unnamed protein product [Amoebophrya sp. A25]|eukprot:GSA25T00007972001.1